MNDSEGGSFSQLHSGALAACGVQPAGWVPGRVQRVLRDTYDRQFKFAGVTGVSKVGTYSTTGWACYDREDTLHPAVHSTMH